jgi:hypothetical protein
MLLVSFTKVTYGVQVLFDFEDNWSREYYVAALSIALLNWIRYFMGLQKNSETSTLKCTTSFFVEVKTTNLAYYNLKIFYYNGFIILRQYHWEFVKFWRIDERFQGSQKCIKSNVYIRIEIYDTLYRY